MKYKFFTCSYWDTYPLLVADNNEGMFFSINGENCVSKFKAEWGIDYKKDYDYRYPFYRELNINQALTLMNSSLARKRMLKFLKISSNIEISNDQKEKIITTLKNNRAFNEDSAYKMSDEMICYALVEKGLIKEYNNKFYIDN